MSLTRNPLRALRRYAVRAAVATVIAGTLVAAPAVSAQAATQPLQLYYYDQDTASVKPISDGKKFAQFGEGILGALDRGRFGWDYIEGAPRVSSAFKATAYVFLTPVGADPRDTSKYVAVSAANTRADDTWSVMSSVDSLAWVEQEVWGPGGEYQFGLVFAKDWDGTAPILTADLPDVWTTTITIASDGSGSWTAKSAPTETTAPEKVAALSLAATSTTIDASWTAPADGGSAITGYTARLFTAATGGTAVQTVEVTSPAATFDGLTADTPYWVSVTATNAIGAGAESDRGATRTGTFVQTETGEIDVTTTLPSRTDGALSWVVSSTPAGLGQAALVSDRFQASGDLGSVKVSDERRVSKPGWSVSARVSGFAQTGGSGVIGQEFLGWTPRVADGADNVQAGAPQAAGSALAQRTLATAAAGAGLGVADLNAGLVLDAPASDATPQGAYTAKVTLTLTSN